jgi:hypothetical protein
MAKQKQSYKQSDDNSIKTHFRYFGTQAKPQPTVYAQFGLRNLR